MSFLVVLGVTSTTVKFDGSATVALSRIYMLRISLSRTALSIGPDLIRYETSPLGSAGMSLTTS